MDKQGDGPENEEARIRELIRITESYQNHLNSRNQELREAIQRLRDQIRANQGRERQLFKELHETRRERRETHELMNKLKSGSTEGASS